MCAAVKLTHMLLMVCGVVAGRYTAALSAVRRTGTYNFTSPVMWDLMNQLIIKDAGSDRDLPRYLVCPCVVLGLPRVKTQDLLLY